MRLLMNVKKTYSSGCIPLKNELRRKKMNVTHAAETSYTTHTSAVTVKLQYR